MVIVYEGNQLGGYARLKRLTAEVPGPNEQVDFRTRKKAVAYHYLVVPRARTPANKQFQMWMQSQSATVFRLHMSMAY